MKLNKDNYTKTMDPQYVTYMYNCNDTNFYMRIKRGTDNKEISLFSGTIDDPQNLFETDSPLIAWNTFEEMLDACAPEQASSGGFSQDRQNPNFLPLLAIKKLPNGKHFVTIFLVDDKAAQKVMEQFTITPNAMPSPIPQDEVFVVDWSDEDIMMVLKCEVLMLLYPNVQFEDDKNAQVFLFIPKSITDQGGEKGGEEGTSGTAGTSGTSGTNGTDGSYGTNGTNGTSGTNGTDGTYGTSGTYGTAGTSGTNGTDGSYGTTGTSGTAGTMGTMGTFGERIEREKELSKQELINKLAKSIGAKPKEVEDTFRNVDIGELFLQTEDFEKIKKDLNLPPQTTERILSEKIINLP